MKNVILAFRQKYKKEKVRMFRTIFFMIVALIYICFFTSKLWIPPELTSKENVTSLGKEIQYCSEERTYKVVSATYDEGQQEFEIVMQLGNRSYDGISDYYYDFDLMGATKRHTVIKEILNDSLVTVVRIYNIKDFREMSFYIAPKLSDDISDITDEQTAFLTFNKYNITYGSIDDNKTADEYLKDRVQAIYEDYLKDEEKEKAKINKLTAEVDAIKEDSIKLAESMEYMTIEEQIYAEQQLDSNDGKVAELQKQIETEKGKLERLQQKIKNAKQKIEEF